MSNRIPLKGYRKDVVEVEQQQNMLSSRMLLELLVKHHAAGDFIFPEAALDDPDTTPLEEPEPEEVLPPVIAEPLPPIPNADMAAAAQLDFPVGRVKAIQLAVLSDFPRMNVADLKSPRRTATIVRARQIAMYLAKELTCISYPEIGRKFGGRDHTTVMHAHRKIGDLVQRDAVLAWQIHRIKQVLQRDFGEH